jgi:hypothetical protein
MGRKKRRKAEGRSVPPAPRGSRVRTVALLAVVAGAVALAVATWQRESPRERETPVSRSPRGATDRPLPDSATPPARPGAAPADASAVPSRFRPLLGEWVRPDGGYVLSVTGVTEEGEATVAYLNPRPINVEQAEAREEGEHVGLFVRLRDRGYPGSTYTLVHDPRGDQLKGLYFQAAQGATYDVVFVRR